MTKMSRIVPKRHEGHETVRSLKSTLVATRVEIETDTVTPDGSCERLCAMVVGSVCGIRWSQSKAMYPSTPIANLDRPLIGTIFSFAAPLLLVDTAVTTARDVATPLPALFVMLASNPVFGIVTVAGVFVIVAVIAVPLELMVTIV